MPPVPQRAEAERVDQGRGGQRVERVLPDEEGRKVPEVGGVLHRDQRGAPLRREAHLGGPEQQDDSGGWSLCVCLVAKKKGWKKLNTPRFKTAG